MSFIYLHYIVYALQQLYREGDNLFKGKNHEQTFTFRIAHYLAMALENETLKIDCEFHRDMNKEDLRKQLVNSDRKLQKIRPDIIYHDRGDQNEFCIEVKKGSKRKDEEKVSAIVAQYGYKEGYCIYNINKTCVTVLCITENEDRHIVKKYKYKCIDNCDGITLACI